MKRNLYISLAVLTLLGAIATALASRGSTRLCAPGYQLAARAGDPDQAIGGRDDRALRAECVNNVHPETPVDLSLAASRGAAHDATTSAGLRYGAHAAALRQAARLAADSAGLVGADGAWTPLGSGPLIADDSAYPVTASEGFTNLSGRVNSFAYDSAHNVLYATVGQGGVWESRDRGQHWASIGDRLPSQPVGSVAYSSSGGGTVIVVTGNDVFGGGTGSYGVGVWWTRDNGATWTKASGVPDDALGFKAEVDPNNPDVVYAATSAGLYRSTDGGLQFTNVDLPTGYTNGDPGQAPLTPNCTGQFKTPSCFLANMVTSVVVQGPSNAQTPNGHPGAVVAVVGWRAGNKTSPHGGYVESPNNGIYTSDTGAPGTFKKVDTSMTLGSPSQIGRTELGATTGADQNHKILYAEVADAGAFQGNPNEFGIDAPASAPAPSNTYFRGIYVSTDWGLTWKQLASATQLAADPTSGSSLIGVGCTATMYCPGVQAWYNQWIAPDPTRSDSAGVPTRLLFGLEEIWANDPTAPTSLDGTTPARFKVVGRYFGNNACQFLSTGLPVCPTNGTDQSVTTLHPDQHAGILIPDGKGGVTAFAGNDGGVYAQSTDSSGTFTSAGWGPGLQNGFHTLMPYDAAIAKDGTVVAGLQDNGELKISPDGKQNEIFDGDGFYSAIDPNNSKTIYEEYASGRMEASTDGGATWTEIHATDGGAPFAMPFQMDATDAQHLIAGGGTDPNSATSSDEYVEETTHGPNTTEPSTGPSSSTDWVNVFDVGSTNGVANQISAVATRGNASYAGFCGACQVLTQKTFASGLATNVGGSAPGQKASTSGWHTAMAVGLPQRLISGISIDPSDPKTVYVALADYDRRWTPAGVLGEDLSKIGTGHIFVSHDAGEHFSDVSGNLPDAPANDVLVRRGQLIAATDVGVYISTPLSAGPVSWQPMGTGLPAGLQVLTLELKPGDDNTLIAATHGRGVYRYSFTAAGGGVNNPAGSGGSKPGSGRGHRPALCPDPSGRLAGHRLGPVAIGEARSRSRRLLPRFRVMANGFDDFCLNRGYGIRAGSPTRRLLGALPRGLRHAVSGRLVIALTANRYYALDGVRPGATLSSAVGRLHLRGQVPVQLGLNAWYLISRGAADGVLKVRDGIVQEVGLVDRRLVSRHRGWVRFLTSFGQI